MCRSPSPLYYLELAKQRLTEGDAQGALEAAEAAVDRSDGHTQYLRMLGGICIRLGYHRKAAEAYEQLLAAFDRGYPVEAHQRGEVLERLGHLYISLQRYGEAVAIYERLVKTVDRPYSGSDWRSLSCSLPDGAGFHEEAEAVVGFG